MSIDFENRFYLAGAFLLGAEALIGTVPVVQMNLILNPGLQKVLPIPLHPNVLQYIMY